jgi:DNA-binding MarR family transcriptional regulator
MPPSSAIEFHIPKHFELFMQRSLRGIMGSMKQDGLSMPQIYILMYLYHEGETRISDIAGLMDVGKAAASQLVERMVQQGLVQRVEEKSDRRARNIRLLPKSLSYLEKGLKAQHRQMGEVLALLSSEQRATVQTAFRYLMEAMQSLDPLIGGRAGA